MSKTSYRTHSCGELTSKNDGKKVALAGWVHHRRDHGGLIFIDLRDRYGVTQIVSSPQDFQSAHAKLDTLRSEYVVQIEGTVRNRPKGMVNPKLSTGEIEVRAEKVTILNESKTPPFEMDTNMMLNEELRLKYRYLDLRRDRLKKNMEMRHKVIKFIRDYMDQHGFLEIETPILIKGTPEGSREYLVPSRLHPGKFYVLPQSPQQLKQLTMVAGLDRYFQIARCFRDEDQRGDRQPEFTQLDLEMSFVDEEDVMQMNEALMVSLMEHLVKNKKMQEKPFPRFTWQSAMERYGSDKPDLRFEMEFVDITDIGKSCGFKVFSDAAAKKDGVVKAMRVPGGSKFTRKEIDEFTEIAKIHGAKGLAYVSKESGELKSPILKFFQKDEIAELEKRIGMEDGDIVFFSADEFRTACLSLGGVRLACADKLGLRDPNIFAFCWVVDFPMFEWSEEEKKPVAAHHPFCSIKIEDLPLLDKEPMKARAKAYDFVVNGVEVGGGSIRIHKPEVQKRIFELLEITEEDAKRRFGHMLEAFTYGAPPHGGIAWGLDRLIMLIRDEPNIREVIAFPKDQHARDLMLDAPSEMPEKQIAELHIKPNLPKNR